MTNTAASQTIVMTNEEIEITAEMIEAGEEAFADHDPRFGRPCGLVISIFEAMFKRSPQRNQHNQLGRKEF